MLIVPAAKAGSARDAWHSLLMERDIAREVYAYIEPQQGLANVLIYGDSISIGYTTTVRSELENKVNVYRLHTNGGDSGSLIGKMDSLHETMCDPELEGYWDFQWDVIHFNVGLHDLKYVREGKLDLENGVQVSSLEQYKGHLVDIIAYLRRLAPGAELVFATTTPVPVGAAGRVPGDAARYNAAALEVLAQYPEVTINDLYAFTLPHHAEWWAKPGNVHYNSMGCTALGKEVARAILEVLD
jgi:hypothetical protein